MSDQIKSFFSTSFAVLGVVALCVGLYWLKDKGWDVSKYYFFLGGGFSIIAQFIEFTRATDDNEYL